MMSRREEVRKLLKLSTAQMQKRAGQRLLILPDIDSLHQHFGESIATEIQTNNKKGRPTKLILPVGPVGQYLILADVINDHRISLKQCWFFMMDEHCDDNGIALSPDHPLS